MSFGSSSRLPPPFHQPHSDPLVRCQICAQSTNPPLENLQFFPHSWMSNHIAIHLGYLPHKCTQCQFQCIELQQLLEHSEQSGHKMIQLNANKNPFMEEICQMVVAQCLMADDGPDIGAGRMGAHNRQQPATEGQRDQFGSINKGTGTDNGKNISHLKMEADSQIDSLNALFGMAKGSGLRPGPSSSSSSLAYGQPQPNELSSQEFASFYGKRVGARKTILQSVHPDNPDLCYTWSRAGAVRADGTERYVCTGCRRMKDGSQVASDAKLPTRYALNGIWVEEGPSKEHFCEPQPRARITGVESRHPVFPDGGSDEGGQAAELGLGFFSNPHVQARRQHGVMVSPAEAESGAHSFSTADLLAEKRKLYRSYDKFECLRCGKKMYKCLRPRHYSSHTNLVFVRCKLCGAELRNTDHTNWNNHLLKHGKQFAKQWEMFEREEHNFELLKFEVERGFVAVPRPQQPAAEGKGGEENGDEEGGPLRPAMETFEDSRHGEQQQEEEEEEERQQMQMSQRAE